MATEEIVDKLHCLTLSKSEAVNFIALLAVQLGGESLTGRTLEVPSLSIEDKGRVLYRLVMCVDRGK